MIPAVAPILRAPIPARAASGAERILALCLVALALCGGSGVAQAAEAGRPAADRWIEIDLYWFDRADVARSADAFWTRYAPLYRGVSGYKGVVLCIGLTPDYILSFSGDMDQPIPLPETSDQEVGFSLHGQLAGDTAQRQKAWRERFSARATAPPSISYGRWTYRDLRRLTDALRARARREGVDDFRVASLTVGVGQAYNFKMPFVRRHPEAFTAWAKPDPESLTGGSFLDPANVLHADAQPLAAYPRGVPEKEPVHAVFGAQWGALAKAAGLEGIMLRDAFSFPRPETRYGPFGATVADAAAAERMTSGLAALIRETKAAAPKTLVMMWSSAATAVADWRANGIDLERIAREGSLDIFVDESWGGAWGEVGVREGTFWNAPILGWTYQLGYMLEHAAVLADTRVRRYPLIETFDAWESWDTIHTAPERLRWAIWAYSHAGAKTPRGLRLPEGAYISWGNHGYDLLDAKSVAWLAAELNAAAADAAQTVDVSGPTLVYSRAAMAGQMTRLKSWSDPRDLTDEQVGSIVKWPVPILSSTRAEWLPKVRSDLFVFGATTDMPADQLAATTALAKQGQPMAFFGATSGGTDPALAAMLGVSTAPHAPRVSDVNLRASPGPAWPAGLGHAGAFDAPPPATRVNAPTGAVVYGFADSAGLVLDQAGGHNLSLWDPAPIQDFWYRPLRDLMNGDPTPFAVAAATLDGQLAKAGALSADVDLEQSGTVAAWTLRGGAVRLLAGNLEEGLRDDADRTRDLTLRPPRWWAACDWRPSWGLKAQVASGARIHLQLAAQGSALMTCGRTDGVEGRRPPP